ncbi:ribonucleoside-diphosphate reductase [Thalassobacillus devorans]|uniref:Ribonucleoside-diphosphate reductase n=1 Tax=Thalassobacillus devorans TaxID=279813 RepID=A0ABQ1PQZ7_9BACI|nr:ribonucleoside-diphosphate reductase subunit alpha [Thalassobacillus devorans]NIK30340.1 ribonucleoside-diphosphate reductase alpha chain [Thalassobacillus devorans]GGD01056.1 ribonucleoside-diphosphate reductase [Thalassobacillus devorans]
MEATFTHKETNWTDWLNKRSHRFPHLDLDQLKDTQNNTSESQDQTQQLILACLALIDEEAPDWTYVAAEVQLEHMYKESCSNRSHSRPYQGFRHMVAHLIDEGIYHSDLLTSYTVAEMEELEAAICPDRDKLFTYIGLKTLHDRYLAKDKQGRLYELPQERFMIIAMTLMEKEPKTKRISLIKEAYWALSNLYMTVATPTLANAGKSYGQLSSCFIDTIDDSLQSIFDSNTDIANLSKHGGGIGVYLGKIRSRGSDIKGFNGVSSGILPWMKQLNNTAVSVDQLGQRQGAIAVYLDVWHKDILSFLDARLNNGDERQRTHDLFSGVSIPDVFMEAVEARGDWYLFDPHEVRRVMGFSLEDFYDEEKGDGSFREKYQACIDHPDLSKQSIPAIEIMKKIMVSQLETGTPYMFYRDEVNRMNPNRHEGMIYCSNLCTEITQNQSPTIEEEHYVKDGKLHIVREPGDFVVCNLSSINLGKAVPANVLERLISIQVRMLDNVIDQNTIPVMQAQLTNQKYRGIGLGTFGWAHLLARKHIKWESEEAVQFTHKVYEEISYHTIRASMELAKEKGAYPAFQGSDWETGEFFAKRNLNRNDSWDRLVNEVSKNGVRNGYMMAVAPNSSTSLIAGSTASIDPIFKKFYSEEKKDFKIPVTAPDLSSETYWYYKAGHEIDQHTSIEQNSARQKYIDQSISFNFYVKNTIKAKELLDLHVHAWKSGLKTTYYTRSTSSQDNFECDSCSS